MRGQQAWTEVLSPPPMDPTSANAGRPTLLSPSSGEGSSSPATLDDAKSADELSQAFGPTTRRPSSSGGAFASANLARQRVREKTRSMVERRKLAKRLSKGQSLAESEGGGATVTEEDIGRGDAQIEQSIQLGAKYVGEGQLSTEQIQKELGENEQQTFEDKPKHPTTPLVSLMPPVPYTAEKAAKFGQMLVHKSREPVPDLEGGQEKKNNIGQYDAKLTAFELSDNVWTDLAQHRHYQQLQWGPPLAWSQWVKQSGSRRWAGRKPTGLSLDINRLEFDHHWLFKERDVKERTLLCAYETFVSVHERTLRAVSEWLSARQNQAEENGAGNAASGSLDALLQKVLDAQKELAQSTNAMERAWENVDDQTRSRFVLRRLEGHTEVFEEECEGGVPDELRTFFRSPLYVLSEQSESANATELDPPRRRALANCRYKIQLFFNDLHVCTSEAQSLQWSNFCVPIQQVFALRVFEPCEEVRVRLLERFSSQWQPLAEIFVPLPDPPEDLGDAESGGKSPRVSGLQWASTVARGGINGSLGCGQLGVPFMQGRLFCALKWKLPPQPSSVGPIGEEYRAEKATHSAGGRAQSPPSLFPSGTLLCSAQELEKHALQVIGGSEAEMDEGLRQQRRMAGELELESRIRAGRQYALALRKHLLASSEQHRRARDLAELVREEPLPSLSLLSLLPALLISRPLENSRRLKPVRRLPLIAPLSRHPLTDSLSHRKLVLNIQFANSVPERTDGTGTTQLFVLCSTTSQSVATTIVDGRHGNWQETLVLDMPMAFDNDHGEQEDNILELELFDREVLLMDHDDRELDTRHEREEYRWLGSASMSLKALCTLGKTDGHIALRGPVFYTGYRSPLSDHPTTIRLLITVDPPAMTSSIPQQLVSDQSGDVEINQCFKFEQRLRQRFANRRVLACVSDTNGKRVVASRFLRRILPPQKIVEMFGIHPKRAVSLAAQYVASIPVLHHAEDLLCAGPPLWSTVEEILRLGTGTPEDFGALLCCWLLGLQLPAVLVLGAGVPGGPNSAMVLAKFPNDDIHWLINPLDGHHYTPSDSTCPMLSVGTLVSPDNVFVNIQRAQHPSQLDFDLDNRAHWEPLFLASGQTDLAMASSVQPEMIRYSVAEEHQLMELRTGLEREIRLQFDQARQFAIPQWNLLASRTLREILVDSWELLPDSAGSSCRILEVDARLVQLRAAFRVTSLAFRVPFISRAQIVRQTLRMQAHTNSEPHVQFALAVHVQPLVGESLLGCSVAICTLLPNGSGGKF